MASNCITIPPEIITEILYRIPAKPLGRFKSVSKEWLSLISDPKFIKTHFKTTIRNQIIFHNINDDLLYSLPFNHPHESVSTPTMFHYEKDHVEISDFCGSCDGIALLHHLRFNAFSHMYMFYNPTTRDLMKLPGCDYFDMMDDFEGEEISLTICTMEGFGYDSVNDDYKVVTITFFCYDSGSSCGFVHVYSLGTNTWRLIVDSTSFDHSYVDDFYEENKGVVVDGVSHWIARNKSSGLQVIIAFSLVDEVFSELPAPNDVDILLKEDCTLFVYGEKLAMFVKNMVWVMNEYGNVESWTKFFVHGLDQIPKDTRMVFDDNGTLLVANNERMFIYDVEKRSLSKTVYDFPKHFLV